MQKNRMIVKGLFVMSLGSLMGLSLNAMDRPGEVRSDRRTIQVSHQKKKTSCNKKNNKKRNKILMPADSLERKNQVALNLQFKEARDELRIDHMLDYQYAKEKKAWKKKDRMKGK